MEETKRDVLLDVEDVPKLGQWITLSITAFICDVWSDGFSTCLSGT